MVITGIQLQIFSRSVKLERCHAVPVPVFIELVQAVSVRIGVMDSRFVY